MTKISVVVCRDGNDAPIPVFQLPTQRVGVMMFYQLTSTLSGAMQRGLTVAGACFRASDCYEQYHFLPFDGDREQEILIAKSYADCIATLVNALDDPRVNNANSAPGSSEYGPIDPDPSGLDHPIAEVQLQNKTVVEFRQYVAGLNPDELCGEALGDYYASLDYLRLHPQG